MTLPLNTYKPGDQVKLKWQFIDTDSDSPVSPSTVTVKVMDPLGVVTNPVAAKLIADGTDRRFAKGPMYQVIVTPLNTQLGIWSYGFYGSVSNVGEGEGQFQVIANLIP